MIEGKVITFVLNGLGGIFMEDEKDREESYYDDEDGEYAVHQLITEAYQSGVIDRLDRKPEKDEKSR